MTERETMKIKIMKMIEECEKLFTWINIPRAPNRSFERVTLSDELLKEVKEISFGKEQDGKTDGKGISPCKEQDGKTEEK